MKLPEYLAKRKAEMVRTESHATHARSAALPIDDVTLFGNPARMYPVPFTEPLDVDAALLVPGGIPAAPPYPYAESAGPYIPSHYAADYQCWLDWRGIAFPISQDLANKQTPACQALATNAGDAFTYQGKVYVPGPWKP